MGRGNYVFSLQMGELLLQHPSKTPPLTRQQQLDRAGHLSRSNLNPLVLYAAVVPWASAGIGGSNPGSRVLRTGQKIAKRKTTEGFAFHGFCVLIYTALDAALNLAGTKAAGANIHLARRTINDVVDALYIGSPLTPGFTIGVTHLVAGHSALITDFAKLTHFPYTSLPTSRIKQRNGQNQTRLF